MGKGGSKAAPAPEPAPAAVSEPPRNVSQLERPDVVPTHKVDQSGQGSLLEPNKKKPVYDNGLLA